MRSSSGIVFSASGRVGKGVICVIYELELASSFRTFWRVRRNAVGVGSESCPATLLVSSQYSVISKDGRTSCRHHEFAVVLPWTEFEERHLESWVSNMFSDGHTLKTYNNPYQPSLPLAK